MCLPTIRGTGLYKKYKDRGLVIMGFPCNQFAERDREALKILNFCQVNYGVSFPMFDKVDVNGKDARPLFEYIKKEAPGALGLTAVKWNFTKFW